MFLALGILASLDISPVGAEAKNLVVRETPI